MEKIKHCLNPQEKRQDKWSSGLRHFIQNGMGRFPVQTPLGVPLGFGIQPCCKAPIDLWVKIIRNAAINILKD